MFEEMKGRPDASPAAGPQASATVPSQNRPCDPEAFVNGLLRGPDGCDAEDALSQNGSTCNQFPNVMVFGSGLIRTQLGFPQPSSAHGVARHEIGDRSGFPSPHRREGPR